MTFYARRGNFWYVYDYYVTRWNRPFKGELLYKDIGYLAEKDLFNPDLLENYGDMRARFAHGYGLPPFINFYYWDGFFNKIKFEIQYLIWVIKNITGVSQLAHKEIWKPYGWYFKRFKDWFPQFLLFSYLSNSTMDIMFDGFLTFYPDIYHHLVWLWIDVARGYVMLWVVWFFITLWNPFFGYYVFDRIYYVLGALTWTFLDYSHHFWDLWSMHLLTTYPQVCFWSFVWHFYIVDWYGNAEGDGDEDEIPFHEVEYWYENPLLLSFWDEELFLTLKIDGSSWFDEDDGDTSKYDFIFLHVGELNPKTGKKRVVLSLTQAYQIFEWNMRYMKSVPPVFLGEQHMLNRRPFL